MRPLRAFRPWLSETLENRTVPTTLGVTVPTGILGLSVTLPKQVPASSPQVQAAFVAFDQSYINAVDTILLAPGSNGLIVPSANREAFDSAVEKSLETLAEQLVLSIPSTSTTTTPSTTSTVSNQVVDAITGNSSTSLESQLEAVSIATIQLNLANLTSVGTTGSSTVLANVVTTAEQVRPTNRIADAESTGSTSFQTSPISTSSASSSSSKAANDVRSAFGNFLNDYFQAVQNTLMAPDATGQVNPAANRSAFDAKVNQALQTLETRLSTRLTRYPATTGLGPQIQSAIEGSDASSLKSQLANLATPTGSQASVVRNFTLGSTQAIAQVLSLISGDVANLLGPSGN
jgi:hypothetical protein